MKIGLETDLKVFLSSPPAIVNLVSGINRAPENLRQLFKCSTHDEASIVNNDINAARVHAPCVVHLGLDLGSWGSYIEVENGGTGVIQMGELRLSIASCGDDIVPGGTQLSNKQFAKAAGAAGD